MANRDFKIELDNVEMINGSDDLLKDTKVTKVTLTGDNKLNSLNSTFENCTELTAIEGNINLDGVSDITEMTLNTPLDEVKVTNPTQEMIQATNSLNQATNVKIGGTKYSKGGIQDVVGSLEWNAENFTYEDTILENVYTNSSNIIDNKNLTIQDTLEQKATSFEVTGQTYMNLVDGKSNQTLLDEMSMQQVEGSPTNFAPHIEQPICVESIEGQTYQNLVDGKGERVLIDEYKVTINDFIPNTFEPPQNQPICIESMEGETYQNLIKGKGEYKLTDAYSHTWTEENNKLENMPNAVEIPEIWGNTVQGCANQVTSKQLYDSINSVSWTNGYGCTTDENYNYIKLKVWGTQDDILSSLNDNSFIQLKANTTYSIQQYDYDTKLKTTNTFTPEIYSPTEKILAAYNSDITQNFTTDSTGKVFIYPNNSQRYKLIIRVVEGKIDLSQYNSNEFDLNYIQSVGDLYVDEEGTPILDEDGNEQYKLEIFSYNNINLVDPNEWIPDPTNSKNLIQTIKLDPNATYTYYGNQSSTQSSWHGVKLIDSNENELKFIYSAHCLIKRIDTFTTDSNPDVYLRLYWGTNSVDHINTTLLPMLVRGSKVLPYVEGTGNNQSNKTTILMPCQLIRIKGSSTYDITDKLLFNKDKGTYIIEKNINTYTTPTINYTGGLDVNLNLPSDMVGSNNNINNYPFIIEGAKVQGWSMGNLSEFAIKRYNNDTIVRLATSTSFTNEEIKKFLSNKNVYYVTNSPQIIETKILEKPSLETYSPKIYITTSAEVQPSQMSITNKRVDFIPLSLQPSKSYTVQLDSVGKDNKPITVNLGGATTTIQPTNDTSKHHRTSITTPSSLTTDNLDLSGEGVVVNDVMLFEGNTSVIKQDVDYMDGIQSIGEPFESRNLFDYTQSEVGLLDHTNGNISEDNSWKYTTDFIPVEPNTTYCISQTSGSVFNYKIVEYNSSKAYLKGTNWTSSKGTDINRAYNTVTTSANTYYLRLGWQSSIFEIQLEEDTFPTEFMAFDTVRYKLEIQTYDSTWDKL